MKILSISSIDIWPFGEDKGIPSIYIAQKEFASRGHKVYFLCPLLEGEKTYSIHNNIHIYRFVFPFNFRKNQFFQIDNIYNRIRATIFFNINWFFFQIYAFFWGMKIGLKLRPDVIYSHGLTPALQCYLISRILSAKLIIRVYGTRQLYWRYRSFLFRLKEFRDYLAFKIPADYFIITDDGNFGNLLAKKLGIRDKKIKYWRNGIEEEFYDSEASAKEEIFRLLNIKSSAKIIASTCSLVPDYQVDKLISLLIALYSKDSTSICLIAGDGQERNRLEELVRRANISSRVFFLGMVDRGMIKKILNAADIFVLLSRYHNCTNTIWEAMACGKCIVTTETEAIKEILTSEKNSILVSRDNFSSLPQILDKLLSDDDLRNALGKNARIRAKEVLEPWSERMHKEIELLERLVKEG